MAGRRISRNCRYDRSAQVPSEGVTESELSATELAVARRDRREADYRTVCLSMVHPHLPAGLGTGVSRTGEKRSDQAVAVGRVQNRKSEVLV